MITTNTYYCKIYVYYADVTGILEKRIETLEKEKKKSAGASFGGSGRGQARVDDAVFEVVMQRNALYKRMLFSKSSLIPLQMYTPNRTVNDANSFVSGYAMNSTELKHSSRKLYQ